MTSFKGGAPPVIASTPSVTSNVSQYIGTMRISRDCHHGQGATPFSVLRQMMKPEMTKNTSTPPLSAPTPKSLRG